MNLTSIFHIAEEMVKQNGEDSYYYQTKGDDFIVASFDGCGGSGSRKYQNYSGKTGAFIASRAVCGSVKDWFCNSRKQQELSSYIQKSLDICSHYADKKSRITGSLGKAFPTTAAIIVGNSKTGSINCFWAGDSRCYMLSDKGLHQLTVDDLDGQDAMSNLINDGKMTNVISASSAYRIHTNALKITSPCMLFSATDGCFGYLKSPMEFEYLIIDSLMNARNMIEWKHNLNEKMFAITGDDYTFCAALVGFKTFDNIKQYYKKRHNFVYKNYIDSKHDVNLLWELYKKDYSMYIHGGEK